MPARNPRPDLFGHPDRSHQKVNWSLKKRWVISLDLVSQKQKQPTADEQRRPGSPALQEKKHNPGKDYRNSDHVQQPVPTAGVLIVILRHKSVEIRQATPPE